MVMLRCIGKIGAVCFLIGGMAGAEPSLAGKLVITAQDGHWASVDGDYQAATPVVPDNLVVFDASVFPPKKVGEVGVEHSVIAPPMAIALSPDEKLALVAAPKRLDPTDNKKLIEDTFIQVVDLTASPIAVIDRVDLKSYPMGVSVNKAGTLALVAHPNNGTVSVLSLQGKQVKFSGSVAVGDAQSRISAVAFTPDGKWALATKRGNGTVAVLKVDGNQVTYTKRDVTVGIQPYGLEVFPNGRLAAICVHGNEDGDNDEIAFIDLSRQPFRTVEHVSVGQTPEGVAISPDNKWMAVSVIQGTNLPKKSSPFWSQHGALQLFSIDGTHARKVGEATLARNNQGVTFSPDGRYVLVQNYSESELLAFRMTQAGIQKAATAIKLSGFPASIRIAP
jgi:6-phosphogluconolactonase (cycloisomerase 2 family)